MKDETEFYLPVGLKDKDGQFHRKGVMRAVTAEDELMLQELDSVQFNDRQRDLELLARLIPSLGRLPQVTAEVLEELYECDFIYLQMLFTTLNESAGGISYRCPSCGKQESLALPTLFRETALKGGFKEDYGFTLPQGSGLKAEIGTKVKGKMAPARCRDFLVLHRDSRSRTSRSWFYVGLLTRCVKKLGGEKAVNNSVIGKLSPRDFSFLVDLFNEVNNGVIGSIRRDCSCGRAFDVELALPGEA